MLPPSSQRKSSQREDFELGLHASHHLKNNPPKGRIPKRWDKNPVQEILPEGRIIDRILLIEGYLHVSTFYSGHFSFVYPGQLLKFKVSRIISGLLTWLTGNSFKDQWKDNHLNFMAENDDNPDFLFVYSDGLLTEQRGRRRTGFGLRIHQRLKSI